MSSGSSTDLFELLSKALPSAALWLSAGLFFSVALGAVVFSPLQAARVFPRPPVRYRLSDIVILLVQLQVLAALVLAHSHATRATADERLTYTIFLGGLMAAWWWEGVRMLSGARIEVSWQRWWFLGFLVPLGFAASILSVWLPFALLATLTILMSACSWGQWSVLWYLLPIGSFASAHLAGIFGCRSAVKLVVKNGQRS